MTTPTLLSGTANYSRWAMRPWLQMAAHELPFETTLESLRLIGSPVLREQLKHHSPSGRVPVLLDGDLAVWDALAICEYVSEQYLNGGGWPTDPTARAYARSVSAEMHAGFSDLRSEMPMNLRARRRVEASEECLEDIDRLVDIFREGRERFADQGDWLAGPFSIADCMYAPVATRFVTYGVHVQGAAGEYLARLLQHPAVTQWMALARQDTEIVDFGEAGDPAH